MRRGTTPTIRIMLNDSPDKFAKIHIALKQDNKILIFDESRIFKEGNTISVKLSQEETLGFSSGRVNLQVRAITEDGTAVAGPIKDTWMNDILEEGEI